MLSQSLSPEKAPDSSTMAECRRTALTVSMMRVVDAALMLIFGT